MSEIIPTGATLADPKTDGKTCDPEFDRILKRREMMEAPVPAGPPVLPVPPTPTGTPDAWQHPDYPDAKIASMNHIEICAALDKLQRLPKGFDLMGENLVREALIRAVRDPAVHQLYDAMQQDKKKRQERAAAEQAALPGVGLTELAASDRFVEKISGECVFNASTNRWHYWNGRVWKIDDRSLIKNRCRTFVKSLYADLGDIERKSDRAEYLGDVEKLNTRRGIDNIVALAAIQLTKRSEDFDSNPHILNLQNGTIEFTPNGITFREHRKEDLCSFIGGCEYRPDEPVPEIWINHAHKIASEDPDLSKTIQTVLGYCLDGGNPLEKIVIAYGAGRNGKSVTFRTFSRILGGYSVNVNPLTLMETGNKTTSPERLKMRNTRLIIAQEPNKPSDQHQKDTTVLDSGFLKAASGKDLISARNLYSNNIEEFAVSGVVTLSTNPLPTVNDHSVAFWDRLVLLPFDYYFRPEERDSHIEDKFDAVLAGILNWFIQGWENYRKKDTIDLCETAKIVLNEYRCADDEYAGFVHDCIEERKGAEVLGTALYDEYVSYTKSRYGTVKNSTTFGRDMSSRFSKKRKTSGIVYRDIQLRAGQMQVPS
ncbi:phage/plasmid primase, P4 family [Methanoregula sp.]|jgi:putative DNA primase/helicase|uniref:DNA primase family protein n=1 Tax=Methanoregula sp. TaxID=2052170 RepID=UPI0025F3F930|nr:phage/plasmid primase, P4 family [Methanoregula sp.]